METLETSKATESNKGGVSLRDKYSLETKMEAIRAYKKDERVVEISKRLNVPVQSIYTWIKKYNTNPKKFMQKRAKVAPAALVSSVIEDIKSGRTGEHTRSFAEDFGVSPSSSHSSNVELKFCPCCGTNIKAVRIALETFQEIKG
jgi:transposase-like protein